MHSIRSVLVGSLFLVVFAIVVSACADLHSDGPLAPDVQVLKSDAEALNSTVNLKRITTALSNPRAEARRNLGQAGGTIEIEGGHTLYFPPGALAQVTEIEAVRLEGDFVQIRFGPHGITFPADKQPVLTLNYSAVGTPNLLSMAIGYLGTDGTITEILASTINVEKNTVTAKLQHFSRYAIVD